MKVVLTNLSNSLFEESRNRLNQSALRHGIRHIDSWDFEDLKKTEFFRQHEVLLSQPKGLGFWAWKPFIILDSFSRLITDDIVIYSDCGHEIIDYLDPLINICDNQSDIILFENGNLDNATWTKRDCFVKMNCDSRKFWYEHQVDASFLLIKKNEKTIEFLQEWLYFCCDWQANTNNLNVLGKKNLPSYIEHRWDQSILSLLRIKWKLDTFRMPSQFGNHYKSPAFRIQGEFNCKNQFKPVQLNYYVNHPKLNSPYFQLLNHHRTKKSASNNNEHSISGISQLIGFVKRSVKRLHTFLHKKFA
jgi:hypothetical protein